MLGFPAALLNEVDKGDALFLCDKIKVQRGYRPGQLCTAEQGREMTRIIHLVNAGLVTLMLSSWRYAHVNNLGANILFSSSPEEKTEGDFLKVRV